MASNAELLAEIAYLREELETAQRCADRLHDDKEQALTGCADMNTHMRRAAYNRTWYHLTQLSIDRRTSNCVLFVLLCMLTCVIVRIAILTHYAPFARAGLARKAEADMFELQKQCEERCNDLDRASAQKIALLTKELDHMRSAFSGDASGWVMKKTMQGEEHFENVDTGAPAQPPDTSFTSRAGEQSTSKPPVLVLAEAMQKVQVRGCYGALGMVQL
jgi:hypothetical protein